MTLAETVAQALSEHGKSSSTPNAVLALRYAAELDRTESARDVAALGRRLETVLAALGIGDIPADAGKLAKFRARGSFAA